MQRSVFSPASFRLRGPWGAVGSRAPKSLISSVFGCAVAFGLACAGVPSSAKASPQRDGGEKVQVVTTLSVLRDIAQAVGGKNVHVESLADPRQDPHFVQPRPTLMKKTRRADVFIEVGLQLELWAQKVVDGSGNPRIQRGQPGRVVASEGIRTLELPQTLSREWGDVHPYGNPHVWLDPINAKKMAENIAAGFARVDPLHRAAYERGRAAFAAKIDSALFGSELLQSVGGRRLTRLARQGRLYETLQREGLLPQLGGWLKKASPLRRQPIVTYHKTWSYFTGRFGLSVPVEVEEKPGITPSARHKDRVIRTIRQTGVKAIVISTFYDPAVANAIGEQTGAKVLRLPIEPGVSPGVDSYFDLIGSLVDSIVRANGE